MFRKARACLLVLLAVVLAGPVRADSDPTIRQVDEMTQSGHIAEAQKMLKQVLRDHPESARAHYLMAELSARRGEFTEAGKQLDIAEQLGPGLPFAQPDSVRALRTSLSRQVDQNAGSSRKASHPHWSALPLLGVAIGVGLFFIRRRPLRSNIDAPRHRSGPARD